MTYQISADACIRCGACVAQCPAGAVAMERCAVVDPFRCTGCGLCADICPVNAPRKSK